jgi:hypothetical protein
MREVTSAIRGILLACTFVVAQLSPASASNQTVKQLAADCASNDQTEELLCMIYFMAFVDGLEAGSALYGAKVPICYPEGGLSVSDWILTFRLWASTHPKDAENGAPFGILAAMVERFPCKNQP